MAKRKRAIPQYGTVVLNGIEYYRTRVEDSDGNRVALYAKWIFLCGSTAVPEERIPPIQRQETAVPEQRYRT